MIRYAMGDICGAVYQDERRDVFPEGLIVPWPVEYEFDPESEADDLPTRFLRWVGHIDTGRVIKVTHVARSIMGAVLTQSKALCGVYAFHRFLSDDAFYKVAFIACDHENGEWVNLDQIEAMYRQILSYALSEGLRTLSVPLIGLGGPINASKIASTARGVFFGADIDITLFVTGALMEKVLNRGKMAS